jgi:hypothetical protein
LHFFPPQLVRAAVFMNSNGVRHRVFLACCINQSAD